MQKRKTPTRMAVKIQKAKLSVTALTMLVKNLVTRNAKIQLKETAKDDAKLLTSGEKSSDIINHGIGPNPIEKAKIKRDMEATGSIPIFEASAVLSWFCAMKKNAPKPAADMAIMLEERLRSSLLPVLSMM
eukprot:TRINITY_DN69131_c0_g1_i1.p2 TRINITY_DN69131_c0_g1~~TRINITY_DN69131_c0_g1_i1.p2  ORF type:complete len:131 (-),score=38.71 TRINITY_DN69131_c0_g1_i1:58-450(-)